MQEETLTFSKSEVLAKKGLENMSIEYLSLIRLCLIFFKIVLFNSSPSLD